MLKSLVKEILSKSAAQSTSAAPSTALLQQTWPALVGQELARCTLPVGWENGVLELEVSSARWLDEFSRQRTRLRKKIAKLLPWPLEDISLKLASPTNMLHFAAILSDSAAQSSASLSSTSPRRDFRQIAAELELSADIIADLEPLDEDIRLNLLRIRQHIAARDDNASD